MSEIIPIGSYTVPKELKIIRLVTGGSCGKGLADSSSVSSSSKYVQGSLLGLACFHSQERTVHDIIPRLERAENRGFVFVIGMEESSEGW